MAKQKKCQRLRVQFTNAKVAAIKVNGLVKLLLGQSRLNEKGLYFGEPKTEKSKRIVPLLEEVTSYKTAWRTAFITTAIGWPGIQ